MEAQLQLSRALMEARTEKDNAVAQALAQARADKSEAVANAKSAQLIKVCQTCSCKITQYEPRSLESANSSMQCIAHCVL